MKIDKINKRSQKIVENKSFLTEANTTALKKEDAVRQVLEYLKDNQISVLYICEETSKIKVDGQILTKFKSLSTVATETYDKVSNYGKKIRSTSWENTGAHSTKGPEHFVNAINLLKSFIDIYDNSTNANSSQGTSQPQNNLWSDDTEAQAFTNRALGQVDKLIAALKTICTWIDQEKSHDDQMSTVRKDKRTVNKAGINWNSEYERAKLVDQVDEFYDRYLNEEWGQEWAAIIKNIMNVFMKETQELGFNTNNPFLFFLRNLQKLCNKKNSTLTTDLLLKNLAWCYPAIHNSLVRGQLSEGDLKGVGGLGLGLNNLIYCSALYGSTGQKVNAKDYLERQKIVVDKFEKGKFSDPKIQAKYKDDLLFLFTKIFFETKRTSGLKNDAHGILEIEDFSSNASSAVIHKNSLRSINEIDRLIDGAFGNGTAESSKTKMQKDNEKVANEKGSNSLSIEELKKLISKLSDEQKEDLKKLLGN